MTSVSYTDTVPRDQSFEYSVLPSDTEIELPDWFKFTLCAWNFDCHVGRNKDEHGMPDKGHTYLPSAKKFACQGSVDSYEFGSVTSGPAGWTLGAGCKHDRLWQWGLVCSPHTHFAVLEEDHPAEFAEAGFDVQPHVLSGSGRGRHNYVIVPPYLTEYIPSDGPVRGGDWQSKGFVPVAGSIHPSGGQYQLIGATVNVATRELLDKVRAERKSTDKQRATAIRNGSAGDDSTGQHHTLMTLTRDLYHGGVPQEEAYVQWQQRADAMPRTNEDWVWDRGYFDQHWNWYERRHPRQNERIGLAQERWLEKLLAYANR